MNTIKRLLLLILLISGLRSEAQVTLKHTYAYGTSNALQWVYLKHSGFKFVLQLSDSLIFYNQNYSVYKSFKIPGNWYYPIVEYVSEGLFDTDTTHIDYLVTTGSCCPDTVAIYQEGTSTLFKEIGAYVGEALPPGMGLPIFTPIFESDSGTFMIVSRDSGNAEVYQLGGSFPCLPSCGNSLPLSINSPQGNTSSGNARIYPNPATSYTDIYYTLPDGASTGQVVLSDLTGKEIKRYTVDTHFTHLHITTSDVAAGTYIYQLIADGKNISSKKLIVVK